MWRCSGTAERMALCRRLAWCDKAMHQALPAVRTAEEEWLDVDWPRTNAGVPSATDVLDGRRMGECATGYKSRMVSLDDQVRHTRHACREEGVECLARDQPLASDA